MVRHTGEPLSKLQTIEVMTSLKCQIPPKFGRAKPPPPHPSSRKEPPHWG